MIGPAWTTVAILRGVTVNTEGDEEDSNAAVATGIPASITEIPDKTTGEANQTPRAVRRYTVRVPGSTDVQLSDRIEDESTGEKFLVDSITRPRTLTGQADLKVMVSRTS